ncbi:8975_t:CDS:2 [Funneliformis geosporum]|uniref:Kinetochore protein NDC80 n=1 Tax=Funneliformis geosporum TaxID=1117311 RepID=A0A9W4S954_9GLOM|nr:8975_t:CDS:2 [Funneliformis geosporum]
MDQYTQQQAISQRRTTLANSENLNSNMGLVSGLRQPMSVMRQRSSRLSARVGQSVSRRSSKAKPENVGSMGFGRPGRMTSLANRPNSINIVSQERNDVVRQKDPRPLRDKTYQSQSINLIINHLRQSNYQSPIEQRNLINPTAKDFLNIFKFLYKDLEPIKDIVRLEDIAGALKTIRYPFVHDISKSSLQAVGNQQTWPLLLEIEQHEMTLESAFFSYLSSAYELFLNGVDEFPEQEEELAVNFDYLCENLIKHSEELQKNVDELEGELGRMNETKDPLMEVRNENQTLRSDADKFNNYTKHLEDKIKKLNDAIRKLEEQHKDTEKQLTETESEKETIQIQVNNQSISPDDVERMHKESEQIANTRNSIAAKMKERNKLKWEKGLEFEKEVAEVENLIQYYNTNLYRIAKYTKDDNYELSVDVNAEIRQQIINELYITQEQITRATEDLQSLCDDIGDKESYLHNLEESESTLSKQFEESKLTDQSETDKLIKRIATYDQRVKQFRTESNSKYIEWKHKRQETQIQYDHVSREHNNAREAMINEFNQIKNEQLRRLEIISAAISSLQKTSRENLNDFLMINDN